MTLPRQSRFEQDLNDDTKWRSSAKIDALLDELRQVKGQVEPHAALQAAERPGAEAAGLVKRQQARRLSSPAC